MKKALRLMVLLVAVAGITTVMTGCQEEKAEAADKKPMDHPAH